MQLHQHRHFTFLVPAPRSTWKAITDASVPKDGTLILLADLMGVAVLGFWDGSTWRAELAGQPEYPAVAFAISPAHKGKKRRPPAPPPPTPSTGRGPQPSIACPIGAVSLNAGDNLAAAIGAHPANTAFCLRAGVHPIAELSQPKPGMTFTGEYGAILDGSTWPRPEANLDASPFLGIDNGVEAVTIRNLRITNMPSYAVNSYRGAARWTVEYCELDGGRNGLSLGHLGTARNSYIHDNVGIDSDPNPALRGGGYGFNGSDGLTLENNEIARNGQEQKILLCKAATVRGNWLHDNHADGLWFDGDGRGTLIEHNVSEDNGRVGMTLENCADVRLLNNASRRNRYEGILLTVSRACTVKGNEVTDNEFGIDLFLDCDSLAPPFPWSQDLADNVIEGNTIRVPNRPGALAAALTFGGNTGCQAAYVSNAKKNNYRGNLYILPNSTGRWFLWGTPLTFAEWQGIPQDQDGAITIG